MKSDVYQPSTQQKNIGIPLLNQINTKNNLLEFSNCIKGNLNNVFSFNPNIHKLKKPISNHKSIQPKRYYSPQISYKPINQTINIQSLKINRHKQPIIEKSKQSILQTMSEDTFKLKDKVIQSLEREIKNLKQSMKNINKEKQEKYSFYESKIIIQIRKNQQLKNTIIQELKKKIAELQKQINSLNLENLKILKDLTLTKEMLNETSIELSTKEHKYNQLLEEYQKTIEEKESIIKKMSFFNDQLCLKIINNQGLIPLENKCQEEIKQNTIQKQMNCIDKYQRKYPSIVTNNKDLIDTFKFSHSKNQSFDFNSQFEQSNFQALKSLIQERSLQKNEQFQEIKYQESKLNFSLLKNIISSQNYKRQDNQLLEEKEKSSYQFNIKKIQGKLLFNYQNNNYKVAKSIIK